MKKPKSQIRCAIYTRKSTEEGLEQDFNSLDAQRDSGEAYIASQKNEGWICLPDRYDDGGFTGGNIDRPALTRLLADIKAGKVDCVVVYKVDRLSRSLMDFSRMMATFDAHNVSFVSVTQQFNTTHSMGRLTLNILLSFAQFEREIISERTRDKIAAARRKGKWWGGHPILGYDIVRGPGGMRIEPNAKEVKRVRTIFETYLKTESLQATIRECNRRGWRKKKWTTKAGRPMGDKPFSRSSLSTMLQRVTYVGKVSHHEQIYDGEHEGIVDQEVFDQVQAMLNRNRHQHSGSTKRAKSSALLKGLVRCCACGSAMAHQFTTKKDKTRYRYYVCTNAHKNGWQNCPSPSVPAPELEAFVVDQIRKVGQDPATLREVLHATQEQIADELADLQSQRSQIEKQIKTVSGRIRKAAPGAGQNSAMAVEMADLQDSLRDLEQEATRIGGQVLDLENRLVDEDEILKAIRHFDPIWESLTTPEKARVVQALVQCVEHDGVNETVSVTFRPNGIKSLATEAQTENAA